MPRFDGECNGYTVLAGLRNAPAEVAEDCRAHLPGHHAVFEQQVRVGRAGVKARPDHGGILAQRAARGLGRHPMFER